MEKNDGPLSAQEVGVFFCSETEVTQSKLPPTHTLLSRRRWPPSPGFQLLEIYKCYMDSIWTLLLITCSSNSSGSSAGLKAAHLTKSQLWTVSKQVEESQSRNEKTNNSARNPLSFTLVHRHADEALHHPHRRILHPQQKSALNKSRRSTCRNCNHEQDRQFSLFSYLYFHINMFFLSAQAPSRSWWRRLSCKRHKGPCCGRTRWRRLKGVEEKKTFLRPFGPLAVRLRSKHHQFPTFFPMSACFVTNLGLIDTFCALHLRLWRLSFKPSK